LDLWTESLAESQRIEHEAEALLRTCPYDLGGGGAYPLLHFLVRLRKAAIVVETGVAAGWSSRAILEALAMNGTGKLYSSDFPYFRFENPEQYIGFVVPEELRTEWVLDVRGDEVALPAIAKQVPLIDIFHYDSDKSSAGRRFAMQVVSPLLGPESIVLMDDIQDNVFFRDYVSEHDLEPVVFEFEGKFVGALGLPPAS
jgi:predicted O-methyltransferase YrrM